MSPQLEAPVVPKRHQSGPLARRRTGPLTAYLAAPLWILQIAIWTAASKVQEQAAPFRITNPLLFELFWLSIAGAVAFSAASAIDLSQAIRAPGSRLSQWAKALATIALSLATAATISTVIALIPAAQSVAITLMTNLLNASLVVLAVSLSLSALVSWRLKRAPRSTITALPTILAAATIAMVVAIYASGTASLVGLYSAVTVAAINGAAWFVWAGRSVSKTT